LENPIESIHTTFQPFLGCSKIEKKGEKTFCRSQRKATTIPTNLHQKKEEERARREKEKKKNDESVINGRYGEGRGSSELNYPGYASSLYSTPVS
jgi:hypothetical protein